MRVIYHCFSCKKDFVDIELAKELDHELTEKTKRFVKDDQRNNMTLIGLPCGYYAVYTWVDLYSIGKVLFSGTSHRMKNKKDIANQSPYLEAVFVEPILEICIAQANFREIVYILRSVLMPSLSDYSLKKYLFYLIDHDLIIYHGKEQIFALTDGGLNLLYMIKREKKIRKSSIDNIMIALEWVVNSARAADDHNQLTNAQKITRN